MGPGILEKRIAEETDEKEIERMKKHIESIKAHGPLEDINTADEKLLGVCVAKKHGTDFYVMDQVPRPCPTLAPPCRLPTLLRTCGMQVRMHAALRRISPCTCGHHAQ